MNRLIQKLNERNIKAAERKNKLKEEYNISELEYNIIYLLIIIFILRIGYMCYINIMPLI